MRISIKNLKFQPFEDKFKANYTFPNGYIVNIIKKKNSLFDTEVFPEVDYLEPLKNANEEELLDYLNQVADIPEKRSGFADFDMNEDE